MTPAEILTLVKKHLQIPETYTDEDTYLTHLINVAKDAVQWQMNEIVEEGEQETDPSSTNPTLHAMLLLVGELYANREISGANDKSLPKSYDYLISTKRTYTVG